MISSSVVAPKCRWQKSQWEHLRQHSKDGIRGRPHMEEAFRILYAAEATEDMTYARPTFRL